MLRRRLIITIFTGLLVLNSSYEQIAKASDDPLVMGIFPRRNATMTFKLYKPMAAYLSKKLGRKVKLVTSKDFPTFWKGVIHQEYDIVHYNQYHYIISNQKSNYQVILINSEFGEPTIAGSVIVRKDSGIDKPTDLKGKTIIFGGGPTAMQSYIVATYLLRQGGLKKGDYVEKFAKNPPNAIISTFYGQADAAGSGDKVLQLDIVKKRIAIDKMKYLVKGEQLPHLPWAVKGSMDPELRNQIQEILSNLGKTDKGKKILQNAKLSGLIKASDKDFDRHRRIVNAMKGIN